MRSRVIWRRSATAIGAVRRGARVPDDGRRDARARARRATPASPPSSRPRAFFQQLLDLTIEEALVKYGFRYIESGTLRPPAPALRGRARVQARRRAARGDRDLSRSRRSRRTSGARAGSFVPMLIALADLDRPVARERRRRRDHPARPLRRPRRLPRPLDGPAPGRARDRLPLRGDRRACSGWSIAQVDRDRGDRARPGSSPSGASRAAAVRAARRGRQAGCGRFLFSSTLASSLDSARGTLGTSLVPTVSPIVQAGYFRNAQAPATGFAALSGPARLVMLTEQTRDFEAGRHDTRLRDAAPLRPDDERC